MRVSSGVSPDRTVDFGPPADEAELAELIDVQTVAFLGTPNADARARSVERTDPSDCRVLRRGGRVAAGLRILRLGQWFGGRRVPMAGVAAVGVAAEHRGGGAGSALVRATLADLHAAGFPLSVLYPATQPVYRRAGYEQAGAYLSYTLSTHDIDLRDRTAVLRSAVPDDRDRIVRAHQVRAARTAGNIDRDTDQWARILPEADGAVHRFVVEGRDGLEGYVSFTQRGSSDGGDIRCRDLVALTPTAARRLLTLFADHRSQVRSVHWQGAPADPLLYVLAEQWHESSGRMLWMLRIVDVRGALAERGYPVGLDAELHLDVRDDVLPWNHGRFVLEVSGGKAKVRKGGRGRLRVDVRGLAPMYTGHHSAAELLAAGYVDGPERDLATAARIFSGPAPWMPDFF